MMMAVLGAHHSTLFCAVTLRQDGEHELEHAARSIGAMREVAMIAGADGEDPQPVEQQAETDRLIS